MSFLSFQAQVQAKTMAEMCTKNEKEKKVGLSFGAQVLPSNWIEDFG
jgi:hypothetical protein